MALQTLNHSSVIDEVGQWENVQGFLSRIYPNELNTHQSEGKITQYVWADAIMKQSWGYITIRPHSPVTMAYEESEGLSITALFGLDDKQASKERCPANIHIRH